jgi:hypothetical protein
MRRPNYLCHYEFEVKVSVSTRFGWKILKQGMFKEVYSPNHFRAYLKCRGIYTVDS